MNKCVKCYDDVIIVFFVNDIVKKTFSVDVTVVTTDTTHVNAYLTRVDCRRNGA